VLAAGIAACKLHGTQAGRVHAPADPQQQLARPGGLRTFVGSGTTLIAAETAVCVGIELNPAYVDVAVECWQRFTGKTAVLEGDGGFFGNLKHCEWAADIPAISVESSVEGGPSQSSKLFQAPGCICFSGRNQSA
jgi:hypothetical protein